MNPQDLCNGRGYAQYEKGILIDGTACSRETFCCGFFTFNEGNEPLTDEEQFKRTCGGYGKSIPLSIGVTGVICHGTANNPNCDGSGSCLALDALVVKGGSCRGPYACRSAYLGSITDKSCYGTSACAETNMLQRAQDTRFNITNESCQGPEACGLARISTHINENSCVGPFQVCYFIEAISVTNGSCRGVATCFHRQFGIISGHSCVGNHACGMTLPGLHHDYNMRIVERITGESCVGDYSCALANVNAIRNKSCVGFQACGPNLHREVLENCCKITSEELDKYTAKINGIIENQSCVGINACTGIRIDGDILEFSCRGDRSCAYAARNFSIIEECQGVEACGRIPIVLEPEPEPSVFPSADEQFSIGSIVGIALACLVFLIGTTMFYFVRRERRKSQDAIMNDVERSSP